MAGRIEARLAGLKIELPQAGAPLANYVPAVRAGDLLFVAGQICQWQGERRFIGKLGNGAKVLDLGCGSGVGAVFCASKARELLAVDINPSAVENTELRRARRPEISAWAEAQVAG